MKSYQIKVQSENRTIVGKEGEPILEAAIRNKVNIKVGCKGGGCGICKIQSLEGEVDQGDVPALSFLFTKRKKAMH